MPAYVNSKYAVPQWQPVKMPQKDHDVLKVYPVQVTRRAAALCTAEEGCSELQ